MGTQVVLRLAFSLAVMLQNSQEYPAKPKLAKDIARVMAAPDLRDQLAKDGGDPMSMTQPEFARLVFNESESAARIAKAAGIRPQ